VAARLLGCSGLLLGCPWAVPGLLGCSYAAAGLKISDKKGSVSRVGLHFRPNLSSRSFS
jgi:hypothetical protein